MLDYRPDLDPRTPNILRTLSDMVPTAKGYRNAFAQTAHTAHTYSLASGESYPNVLFASRWLSQPGGIVLTGSNKRLSVYDFTNGFINVSKAGDYTLGGQTYQYGEDSTIGFDLCAFGDLVIACNKVVPTQLRNAVDLTSGTLFADLTDGICPPPKANTCCVARNFVFLGDCASWASVTGSPDILAWSGLGNHLDWSNNPTITQSSFAQFNDTPGAITVVRPFRDGIVVFKANSMYLGRYVGGGNNSPIWDFVRVSDKIGCVSKRSVVDIDNAVVFVGQDDIYSFDGTFPVSITQGIYELIRTNLTSSGNTAMAVGHDKPAGAVWFDFGTSSVTYVWSYKYNRWGRLVSGGTRPNVFCQTNSDDFRTKTLSTVTAGVQSYTTSTNHYNLYTLHLQDGSPKNRNTTRSTVASFNPWVWGAPNKLQTLTRISLLFGVTPTTVSNITGVFGGAITPNRFPNASTSFTMNSSYRMDTLTMIGGTNNFFNGTVTLAEDSEIMEIIPELVPAGAR